MRSLILVALLAAAATTKPAPPPDLTSPPADAERAGNGLLTKQLVAGSGADMPADDAFAKIRYTLWTSDGTVKDFVAPPQSVIVPVGSLMPGMKQTLTMMHAGEQRRAWIPERLAGRGSGPLVADIELLRIIHPPFRPADVGMPPADAVRTKSGLAYRVLRKGSGTRHPKLSNTVVVHYSGWQSSGHLFDSSILRDEPAEFPLEAVIAGWREGLQLMTEGERARFWIPEELAYKGVKGKPQGMLVFDVELIKIK